MQLEISGHFWANLTPDSTSSNLKSYETARRMSEIWFVPIREEQSPDGSRSEYSSSSDDVSFTSDLTPLSPARTTMCFMNTQRSDATCECDFTCEGMTMNMLSLAISPDAFNESSSELELIFSDHVAEQAEETAQVAHGHRSVATPVPKREIHKSVFYADMSLEERSRLPKSNLYLYSITRESSGPDKAATMHQYWELCQEDVELCAITVAPIQPLPLVTVSFVNQNLDSVDVSVASEDLEDEESVGGTLIHPACDVPKKKSVTFVDGNSVHLLRRDFHCGRSREMLMQESAKAKRHAKRKKKKAAELLRRHGDQLTNSPKITPRPDSRLIGENAASDDVTISNLDVDRNAIEKRMTTLRFYRSASHLRSTSLESFKGSFEGSNKTENPPIKSANYRAHKTSVSSPSRIMKNTSSNPDFSFKGGARAPQCKENTDKDSTPSKKCFEKFSRQGGELGQSESSALNKFGTLTPFERDSLDERLLEALLEQNAMRRTHVPPVTSSALWGPQNRKVKPGNNNCGQGCGAGRGKALPCRSHGGRFTLKPFSLDNHQSRISMVKEIPKPKRPDYRYKPSTLRKPASLKGRFKSELTLSHKIRKPSQFKTVASCRLLTLSRPKHCSWLDTPQRSNIWPRNEASYKIAKLLTKAQSEPVLSHLAQQRPSSSKKRKSHVTLVEPAAEDGRRLCTRGKQGVNRTRSNSATAVKKSLHKLNSSSRDLRRNPHKHHWVNPQRSVSFGNTKTCSGGGHKKRKASPFSYVRHCPAWTRSQPKIGTPGKEKSAHSCKFLRWSLSHFPLSESSFRQKNCRERLHGTKGHSEKNSTKHHKNESKSGSKKKTKNGSNPTKKKSSDLRRCRSSSKIGKSKSKSMIKRTLVYASSSNLIEARAYLDCAESPIPGTSRKCETPKEDSMKVSKAPPPRVEMGAGPSRRTTSCPESRIGNKKKEEPKAGESNIFSIIHDKFGIKPVGTARLLDDETT